MHLKYRQKQKHLIKKPATLHWKTNSYDTEQKTIYYTCKIQNLHILSYTNRQSI